MTDAPRFPPPPGDGPDGTPPPSDAPPPGSDAAPPGYGAPPPPYGAAPPAYGAPPPYGSAGPGFGAAPGMAGAAAPYRGFAEWPLRVQSALVDSVGPGVLGGLLSAFVPRVGWLFSLLALAWTLYQAYLGGKTGQSMGKRLAGTRLVGERTGTPIGGGMGVLRALLHIVDSLPCYVGYLWPLWDSKRQTFADKILATVVLR